MNPPNNFLGSLFWDGNAQAYSMSRMVMFGSFLLTFFIGCFSLWIIYDSYIHYKVIPDLSWLLYGGTGTGATSVIAYGMNKFGGKNDGLQSGGNDAPELSESTDSGNAKTDV